MPNVYGIKIFVKMIMIISILLNSVVQDKMIIFYKFTKMVIVLK